MDTHRYGMGRQVIVQKHGGHRRFLVSIKYEFPNAVPSMSPMRLDVLR